MYRKIIRAALAVIAVGAAFVNVYGQFGAASAGGGGALFDAAGSGAITSRLQIDGAVPSIDNTIDTNDYLVGGGDVFFITAVESPSIRHTATVDPSGRILINNVGAVDLGKIPYREAKRIIAERVSRALRRPSEVYVTLAQIKNATVSLTGAVAAPGSFTFPGNTRLLDAIRQANGGELPPPDAANLRQVRVTNGESVVIYDLLAYLHLGNAAQNPYIYPGDRVRVDPTSRSVTITGAVGSPGAGAYPLREGETLREFLTMFTLESAADTNSVIIFQSATNTRRTLRSDEHGYTLANLDVITIPVIENFQGVHSVSIYGEVARPGQYNITENSTSAGQLIAMAGGMTETANPVLAVIVRPIRNLPDRFSDRAGGMNIVRPERGASAVMAHAMLDYTVIRLTLYNADEVILEPHDRVIVPKRDRFVYISGAVKNPGAYLFRHGRDIDFYVRQAGGFARGADRTNIQVYMRYGDVVQNVEPRCIEAGGVIIVPTSTQYRVLTQVVLPILSTVATIVMAGLAIYNVDRGGQ